MEDGIARSNLAFDVFLHEYSALKAEQTARIGFRDNLLYITLSAVGAVFAFSTTTTAHSDTLLVIPWISVILGWTYVANDHHISRIGRYVRENLRIRMRRHFAELPKGLFNWEFYHRSDKLRISRKRCQLVVDTLTFIASGVTALIVYCLSQPSPSLAELILVGVEAFALLALAVAIVFYADVFKSKSLPIREATPSS